MTRDQARAAADREIAHWEAAISAELVRLFERQEKVVLARLQGTKARKHTRHWEPAGTRPLEVKGIIDAGRWATEARSALEPVVRRLFVQVYGKVSKALVPDEPRFGVDPSSWVHDDAGPDLDEAVTARLDRIAEGVESAVAEVETFIAKEEDAGSPMPDIVAGVRELYAARVPVWAERITIVSATGSINQAGFLAAIKRGSAGKQWLSKRDERVRDTHEHVDGQLRALMKPFRLGGFKGHPKVSLLMFPGDPSPHVPIEEVINCRCVLLFLAPSKRGKKGDPDELETKDRVRTAAGARHYGQPIGSVIVPDPTLAPAFSSGSGAPAATRAPAGPGKVLGRVGGARVQEATNDPAVRAVIAKYAARNGTPVPDPATTRVIALFDRKDRPAAYVVWQSEDGPSPKGTVVEVSVHPSLRGNRVGDSLVQLAVTEDSDVVPTTRPSTRAPAPASPAKVSAPARPAASKPAADPNGNPVVRSRAMSGDTPGTSGDYKADAARIERLQQAYLRDRVDTSSLFSRGGRWSRAREQQQQQIIDHFLNQPGVKADRKLLVIGGLPGAGKTTTINSAAGQAALGIDLSEYVTVNADEVKAEMIARGMVPDYPGLTPDEAATLFHAESFEVAHSLMRQAAKQGKNFAYDTSLKSSSQVSFATGAASRQQPPPYEVTMLFVDVPVAVAKQRARDRYLAGERYMPLGLIDRMKARSSRFSSGPSEQFEATKRQADRWVVFDNSGATPVLTGQGGKRSRSVAPARSNAPMTPTPSATSPAPAPTTPAAPVAVPSAGAAGWTPPAGLPPVPAGALVYTHPQGKTVYVMPDGSMQVYKPGGKKATSSATPQKLAAGYGGWIQVVGPDADPAGAAAAAAQVAPAKPAPSGTGGNAPSLVAAPAAPLQVSAGVAPPRGALPVSPMDFNEMPLADVPKYIADPNYVAQQKVDGIRGVLVVEPGQAPWFASKKGDKLVSSTAAKVTGPMLAKLPPAPAGTPAYRVEGEILNGKFHAFDMYVVGEESTSYEERQKMVAAWTEAVKGSIPQVEALPLAVTQKQKQALWDAVLNSGAEGVMFKRKDAGYHGGQRVSHTLKAKITATADVVVLERNIGGKDNARIGLSVGGKVTPIGTISTLGKGTINVGDVLEVEYLWATPSNTLAQPRILRKRPDKNVHDVTDASQLRIVDKAVLATQAKRLVLDLEYAIEAKDDD